MLTYFISENPEPFFYFPQGIASEGLCSAICSLYTGPTPCELYVYTSLTCYIGSLYTLGSYTTQPAGNYTLNTKKCMKFGFYFII